MKALLSSPHVVTLILLLLSIGFMALYSYVEIVASWAGYVALGFFGLTVVWILICFVTAIKNTLK